MTARFHDHCALITGAASGIGLGCAQRLADEGAACLVLADLDPEGLEAAANAVAREGLAITILPGDVADPAHWAEAAPVLSGVTLGIVNAGITDNGMIADMDFAAWRRVLAVNLDGAFLTMQALMRAMGAGDRGGAIVLTASASGLKAEPGVSAYAASKAGAIQLAKVAAREGAPQGIRVNAIAPGGVETPIWRKTPFFQDLIGQMGSEAAAFAAIGAHAPLGRFATVEEIAAQIAFLLSAESANMTGAVLVSDGGYLL